MNGRPRLVACTALAASLVACGIAQTEDVPLPAADATAPAPEPLSRLGTWGLGAFLGANVAWGSDVGYVALFARDGRVVHAATAGHADREAGQAMAVDTRMRIASMTKPVTAVAALVLVDDGTLTLDDPVARYVPAAGLVEVATQHDAGPDGAIPTEPLARPLTVRDLLEFRAGIGARGDTETDLGKRWAERDLYAGEGSLATRVDRLLAGPLYEQPGERWRYGWSADVLARVVEVAAGEPFGDFVRRRILDPLGMQATGFLGEDRGPIGAMYTEAPEGGLVRVERPRSDAIDWTPGGSGLVSTAPDYLRFALMLWNGGSYDGTRILAEATVADMTRPHVPEGVLIEEGIDGLGWGLGLAVVVDADATPLVDRDGDFWWSGYYGTTFFVSPSTGLTGVVMTQNQPAPHSSLPYPLYIAPAFARFGL